MAVCWGQNGFLDKMSTFGPVRPPVTEPVVFTRQLQDNCTFCTVTNAKCVYVLSELKIHVHIFCHKFSSYKTVWCEFLGVIDFKIAIIFYPELRDSEPILLKALYRVIYMGYVDATKRCVGQKD